jgi:hypothetical protein
LRTNKQNFFFFRLTWCGSDPVICCAESQVYLHGRPSCTGVLCFGAVREGEVGTRTRIGYSFIVREPGGRMLEITPCQGITENCLAHAINHTCQPDFENCKFVYAGITRDPRGVTQEDGGGVGGRSTSIVFVQLTRLVEREEEFYANYGTDFLFPHGCECHLCSVSCCDVMLPV